MVDSRKKQTQEELPDGCIFGGIAIIVVVIIVAVWWFWPLFGGGSTPPLPKPGSTVRMRLKTAERVFINPDDEEDSRCWIRFEGECGSVVWAFADSSWYGYTDQGDYLEIVTKNDKLVHLRDSLPSNETRRIKEALENEESGIPDEDVVETEEISCYE